MCTKHWFFSCSIDQPNFCIVPPTLQAGGKLTLVVFAQSPAGVRVTLQPDKVQGWAQWSFLSLPGPLFPTCLTWSNPAFWKLPWSYSPRQATWLLLSALSASLCHHQEAGSRALPFRTCLSPPPLPSASSRLQATTSGPGIPAGHFCFLPCPHLPRGKESQSWLFLS